MCGANGLAVSGECSASGCRTHPFKLTVPPIFNFRVELVPEWGLSFLPEQVMNELHLICVPLRDY